MAKIDLTIYPDRLERTLQRVYGNAISLSPPSRRCAIPSLVP